ncbi:MAG: putative quinol monooxygenase [Pseudomonadota bacterium]
MPDYCVTVFFRLQDDAADAFLPLMVAQAAASLTEPGCRVFDIWRDPARTHEIWLYEVYDDRAAFEAHLATPHFRSFDRKTAEMVAAKRVVTFSERIDPHG